MADANANANVNALQGGQVPPPQPPPLHRAGQQPQQQAPGQNAGARNWPRFLTVDGETLAQESADTKSQFRVCQKNIMLINYKAC